MLKGFMAPNTENNCMLCILTATPHSLLALFGIFIIVLKPQSMLFVSSKYYLTLPFTQFYTVFYFGMKHFGFLSQY